MFLVQQKTAHLRVPCDSLQILLIIVHLPHNSASAWKCLTFATGVNAHTNDWSVPEMQVAQLRAAPGLICVIIKHFWWRLFVSLQVVKCKILLLLAQQQCTNNPVFNWLFFLFSNFTDENWTQSENKQTQPSHFGASLWLNFFFFVRYRQASSFHLSLSTYSASDLR